MKHIVKYDLKEYQTDYFNSIEFLCGFFKKVELTYDSKSCDEHIKILNQLAIYPDDIDRIEDDKSINICRKCLESEHIEKYIHKGRQDYIDYKLKFAKHKISLMSRKIMEYEEGKKGKMPENNETGATFLYSNENNEANTSSKNLVYHQKLEPNYCEINSDTKGRMTFKVCSHAADIQTAIENAVESYNKIAKVINRPIIDLNTVVGSQNSEILTNKNEELMALEKWEENANYKSPKGLLRNRKYFGNKLRIFRKNREIKIYKMAQDLGLTKENLLDMELCKILPKDKNILINISEYLNLGETKMALLEKSYTESLKIIPKMK